MSEIKRIAAELTRTFEGDAWYGPSVIELLDGMTAAVAFRRLIPGAHTIAEIVLHSTAWEGAVKSRLEGNHVELPEEGDWPGVDASDEAGWAKILQRHRRVHDALAVTVASLSENRLGERLGSERDRATGGGMTVYSTLHGIIHHNVYHAGQIAVLKKG